MNDVRGKFANYKEESDKTRRGIMNIMLEKEAEVTKLNSEIIELKESARIESNELMERMQKQMRIMVRSYTQNSDR